MRAITDNKALTAPEMKHAGLVHGDLVDADKYPAAEGWRPLFNRSGVHHGWYNDSWTKLVELPNFNLRPVPTPGRDEYDADPEREAARLVMEEKRQALDEVQTTIEDAYRAVAEQSMWSQTLSLVEKRDGSGEFAYMDRQGVVHQPERIRYERALLEKKIPPLMEARDLAEKHFRMASAEYHRVSAVVSRRIAARAEG